MKKIESNQLIKLVFLGCGYATRIHTKTLKKLNEVELYYASRSIEKAKNYNNKFKGKGAFGSYHDAIRSNDINVVFIATPPKNHLSLAIAAMKAGKHVIIEKPPFFHSTDFDTIKQLQEKTQTQVMIAENYFYKPNLKKLNELLKSGIIGQPKFLYLNATKKQHNEDWRNDESLTGGGALFEGGIHWINFISNLGLTIKSITGKQPNAPTKMEKSTLISFEYEEDMVGSLFFSWEVDALAKGVRISKIYGTQGSITFESNGVFIFVRGKKWKWIFPQLTDLPGYKGMFRDFINAIRNGHEPKFNLDLAKRDLVYIEKIYQDAGVSRV